MPRPTRDTLPARPERNDLGERLQDILDRFGADRGHDAAAGAGPRLADILERRAERDGSGPQRDFGGGEDAAFTPRDGVHDQLRTHEFHHDWFFG